MDVRISIDFGQGYMTALTVEDARRLYETLREVFEPKESLAKAQGWIMQDLREKGYEVYTASGNVFKAESRVEDQASPTEAPGTLRENGCRSKDCNCNEWTTSPEVPNYGS